MTSAQHAKAPSNPRVANAAQAESRPFERRRLELSPGDRIPQRPAYCGLAPWQIGRVLSHIDRNLESRLMVTELAALTRLSPSYFSRVFHASFGVSPHHYVLHRRIQTAQTLMLNPDATLSSIALLTGFSDQAHMSRTFRRLIGVTPRACRLRQAGQSVG